VLHKANEMRGYHIVTTDGEIGHVDDFLIEEGNFALRYLVVDTSNWIGGRSVLISAATITRIDSPARKIHVALTQHDVKSSPSVDAADIDPAETLPALWIM
jgi:sporulation protein YlmC with PRC-barrel domain